MKNLIQKITALILVTAFIFPASISVKASTIDASFETGGDDYRGIYSVTDAPYQTFTATANETLDRLEIYAWRKGTTGTIYAYLTDTTLDQPDNILTSVSINATSAFTLDIDGGFQTGDYWYSIDFNNYPLVAGTKYALVMTANFTGGNTNTNTIKWARSNAGGYAGGNNGIGIWTGWTTLIADHYFRTYVTIGGTNETVIQNGGTGVTANLTKKLFGWVANIGSDNVTELGFEWGIVTATYTDNVSVATDIDDSVTPLLFYNFTDNLTVGTTYYWRAFGYDGSYVYSSEDSFIFYGAPTLTTGGVTQTVVSGESIYTFSGSIDISGNSNNTSSMRGFDIGTSSGNYNPSLQLEEWAGSAIWAGSVTIGESSWNGTIGNYNISHPYLTANTTYYYRAWATTIVDGASLTGYGSELSFTTSTGSTITVPIVETLNGIYLDGVLSVTGSIISSSVTIIERGINFGLTNLVASSSSDLGTFATGLFIKSSQFIQAGGVPYNAGTTIYYQSYAVNSLGNTGYGSVKSLVIPNLNVGLGGMTIVNSGATVNGNTALLTATITNPSNVQITRIGFAWGLTSEANDNSYNTAISGISPTNIAHTIVDLDDTVVYWYQSGVLAGNSWLWSEATSFTTGTVLPDITGTNPIVVTLDATEIGNNYFKANGNLTSKGLAVDSLVDYLGFVYSLTNSGSLEDWSEDVTSGNFSTGAYSKYITLSQSGQTLYIASVAYNQYGHSYGTVKIVNMSSGTSTGATQPTGQFAAMLKATMAKWGMDNTSGHWAFMVILELIIAFVFLVLMFALAQNNIERIVLAIIWMLIAAGIFATFLFSGLLGTIAVLLIIVFVATVLTLTLKKFFKSGEA